jgi:hypothetical protein
MPSESGGVDTSRGEDGPESGAGESGEAGGAGEAGSPGSQDGSPDGTIDADGSSGPAADGGAGAGSPGADAADGSPGPDGSAPSDGPFDVAPESGPADAACASAGPIILPNGVNATASGINGRSQIVGSYGPDDAGVNVTAGAFWESPTSAVRLLASGGFGSVVEATAISSASQIVGVATVNYGADRLPVFWGSPTATPTQLSTGGFSRVRAQGINGRGEIVGQGVDSAFHVVPLYWASDTSAPVALLATGDDTAAYGIDDAGRIVGTGSVGTTYDSPALLWSSATSAPMALPGGGMIGRRGAEATGIDGLGRIVGVVAGPVVWPDANGDPVPLPFGGWLLAGSAAFGISDKGEVVGAGEERRVNDAGMLLRAPAEALYWTICP